MKTVTCACGEDFKSSAHNAKYCSEKCRKDARRKRNGNTANLSEVDIEESLTKIEEIDGEIWIDVEGYEGLYKISNFGRVLSIKTLMSIYINSRGYKSVRLHKEGKQKNFTLHRLLANHFIPNPQNLPEVDHKNRDKLDNSLENLRWCSRIENSLNRDFIEFKKKVYEQTSRKGTKTYSVRYYPDGYVRKSKNFKTYEDAEDFANKMIEEGLFYPK